MSKITDDDGLIVWRLL